MRLDKQQVRKPLFTNSSEASSFLNLFNEFDEQIYIEIAKLIFIDGLTNEEVSEKVGYSKRQIERLRPKIMGIALKRAIRKAG